MITIESNKMVRNYILHNYKSEGGSKMSVVTITKDNFQQVVTEAQVPVLVDFWATWCGPCRMLSPLVDEVAGEVEGEAIVGKVNVDEQPELAQKFGVMSIPTLLV